MCQQHKDGTQDYLLSASEHRSNSELCLNHMGNNKSASVLVTCSCSSVIYSIRQYFTTTNPCGHFCTGQHLSLYPATFDKNIENNRNTDSPGQSIMPLCHCESVRDKIRSIRYIFKADETDDANRLNYRLDLRLSNKWGSIQLQLQ